MVRLPISAAKLEDTNMAELLLSSGATNFFTLVSTTLSDAMYN